MAEIELATAQQVAMKMEVTRGVLPPGTDLNDFRGYSRAGSWRLDWTQSYHNLPFELNGSGVLEMVATDLFVGAVQRVTQGSKTAYREADNSGNFGEWSVSVAPVVSEDATHPLEEGQTLYVIDPNHAATIWPTIPWDNGWTYRWGTDREEVLAWQLLEPGRGSIRMLRTSSSRCLTWDKFDGLIDADITATGRISATTGSFGFGPAARVSGEFAERNGIIAGLVVASGERQIILYELVSNTLRVIGRTAVDWPNEESLSIRLQVEGAAVRAKVWETAGREPAQWQVEGVATVLDPGATGINTFAQLGRFLSLEVRAL